MIGGFFFLASIIAIFIVLNWFIKNDKIADGQPTQGLLAMKLPDEAPAKKPRRWSREGSR